MELERRQNTKTIEPNDLSLRIWSDRNIEMRVYTDGQVGPWRRMQTWFDSAF
jgi:hypothetical protein